MAGRLTVVGDGPDRDEPQALAERLGVRERVGSLARLVKTRFDRSTAPRTGSASLEADGLPVVLMEAMAPHVPIVASQIMRIPELIEGGRTGRLVTPGRVDSVVQALEHLWRDPAARDRLGQEGRRKVLDEFDVDAWAPRPHSVLTAAIGSSG